MKDLKFLRGNVIAYRGIYDNERIFENTLQACARANKYECGIELDIKILGCGTVICFHDDNLERMLHVDQDLSKITYDELSYISKYQIPTLEEVLMMIKGSVPLVLKLEGKSKKYVLERKVSDLLDNYEGGFAIVSSDRRRLKWFSKNKPEFITGYIVDSNNYLKFLFFKKCDFFTVDVKLFNDKYIRKLRESKFIVGHVVCKKEEYEKKKQVYDNLVVDNTLEIIDVI